MIVSHLQPVSHLHVFHFCETECGGTWPALILANALSRSELPTSLVLRVEMRYLITPLVFVSDVIIRMRGSGLDSSVSPSDTSSSSVSRLVTCIATILGIPCLRRLKNLCKSRSLAEVVLASQIDQGPSAH